MSDRLNPWQLKRLQSYYKNLSTAREINEASSPFLGPRSVGVAPGTTVIWDPYGDMATLKGRGFGALRTTAIVRWDLILGVGGGALVIAMLAGLVANAFRQEIIK